MMVYLLEVDCGMGFEVESVWRTLEGATAAAEMAVKYSVVSTKCRISLANVRG